jgi:uncharacterized protein (DUF58 family)
MRQPPAPPQRIVYIEQDEYAPLPAYQQREMVVVVQKPRRPRSKPPFFLYSMSPFMLASLALVAAVFLVDDVQWLMERMLLLMFILFLAGAAAAPLLEVYYAFRYWRDDYYD